MLAGVVLVGVLTVGAAGPASASGRGSASGRATTQPLTWTVAPTANQGFDGLGSLSCLSATVCFATGSRVDANGFAKTLIESWNGHGFSLLRSRNPGPFDNALGGISCVSAAFCVTVGSADNKRDFTKTLVESWDGTTWSVVPSPSPGSSTFIDELGAVSCASATFCIAVGSYGPGELDSSLVEAWNGSSWQVIPSPRRGPDSDAVMSAIDCPSMDKCMGVGDYITSAGLRRTFAATWNGISWTVLPTPNRGQINNVNNLNSLAGVSCLSPRMCIAVGSWSTAQTVTRTLVESWNGNRWSVAPSPNRGSRSTPNNLVGIACVSASDCIATGSSGSGPGGSTKTLIESWNGAMWVVVSSPNKGRASDFNSLRGIACPSASLCITVGSYANINAQRHTLAEIGTPA